MVAEPWVNHEQTATGGVGDDDLNIYRDQASVLVQIGKRDPTTPDNGLMGKTLVKNAGKALKVD